MRMAGRGRCFLACQVDVIHKAILARSIPLRRAEAGKSIAAVAVNFVDLGSIGHQFAAAIIYGSVGQPGRNDFPTGFVDIHVGDTRAAHFGTAGQLIGITDTGSGFMVDQNANGVFIQVVSGRSIQNADGLVAINCFAYGKGSRGGVA